ncbi:AbrB family transcriptional regulator [Streptococcus caviae]|uniref:AbrB family transcriptional regulator n=1 Tax=Streptococcus sp. 'caviae' TaxID=1915004 RepID=UPI00094B7FA3|nr:AbrB family transcriptional regulator [Streptococcus sp. 'caviae']OLN83961.1 ammonia monooxygenase [Streptococcus sp. 'caviae']
MILQIAFTLLVGLLGGITAKKLQVPAPFMIGSMVAVAIFSIITGQMKMEASIKIFAQIVSGAYIGQQVSKKDLLNLPKLAVSIASLMILFTINMILIGFVFILCFKMDAVTAFLSCLPGGIVDVSLMSIDMGAQSDIVATLQSARLVGILIILPMWVAFITKRFAPEDQKQEPVLSASDLVKDDTAEEEPDNKRSLKEEWLNNAFILAVASIGGLIGMWLDIPVGALIFSLIFSSILKITKNTVQLTKAIRYIAQVCAGSLIGINFTQKSLIELVHLIIPIILLLTSYLIINAFFGFVMYKRGILDLQSALFASSPAGATDISLLAGELGGDMPKIAGIQISRTLYTVIVMPILVRFIVHLL